MANCKNMAVRSAILRLWEGGWSKSRIARELKVHRETVGRHIRLAAAEESAAAAGTAKPSIPPTGAAGSKPSILPAGKSITEAGRRSQCAAHEATVVAKAEQGLSAQRIYQDLVSEQGFEGSYDAVKRFCRKLKAAAPDRIWRIECLPGEEAQVDFGTGYYLEGPDGKRRKAQVLRVVLSHSRNGIGVSPQNRK
jgi:hypothetical protein